jgi:Protein of unknown function (DUF2934)
MAAESGPADQVAAKRQAIPPLIRVDELAAPRQLRGQRQADLRRQKKPPQRASATPLAAEPKAGMTDRDQHVRDIAYFLWLEDGCPEGDDERHWLAAETLVDSEPPEAAQLDDRPADEPKKTFPR